MFSAIFVLNFNNRLYMFMLCNSLTISYLLFGLFDLKWKLCSCMFLLNAKKDVNNLPGVGVAIPMAFVPVGVTPLGVIGVIGVMGVIGVIMDGVWGVWFPNCEDGVSSQRDLRLLALGVGVSWIKSVPVRSVRGVSAHPLPWAGVSVNEIFTYEKRCKNISNGNNKAIIIIVLLKTEKKSILKSRTI